MEIVLLQDVKSLGKKGQVVKVNDGYARNFILPKKLGVEANAKNLNDLKLQKANDAKVAAEQTVEHGRGQSGVLGGFSDADRHGIILDQEADCGCKFQVRDGDHIGACASDDGGGADHDGFNWNFLIFEHFLHGFGKFQSGRDFRGA